MPSTRRLLNGVAMPVPRRSTELSGAPDTLVDFHTGRDGVDNLVLVQVPRLVHIYHVEDLAGHGQELRRKVLVGGGRGACAALALLGELLEAALEAALDRLLPARDRRYVYTRRRRRWRMNREGRRVPHHSSTSISPEPSVSRALSAFLRRAGCRRNCRFSSPQFWRKDITS